MKNFRDELKARTMHVNAIIKDYLPKEEGFQKTLLSAMNYSMEAGGKRIRPMIMECSYQMYGGTGSLIGPFMAAVEMVHTSSLIHDDLPELDNDDMRRGKKATHRKFGQAMAVLAGDALENYAYETATCAFDLARGIANKNLRKRDTEGEMSSVHFESQLTAEELYRRIGWALRILACKSGINGMLGGQSCDVEHGGQMLTEGQVEFININKTAALIEGSLMIGAVLAGAEERDVLKLEMIGSDIGVAFQIRDDILDVTGNVKELGKMVGSDVKNRKTTYISLFGLAAGKKNVERLSDRALKNFDSLSVKHDFLRQLFVELASRRK